MYFIYFILSLFSSFTKMANSKNIEICLENNGIFCSIVSCSVKISLGLWEHSVIEVMWFMQIKNVLCAKQFPLWRNSYPPFFSAILAKGLINWLASLIEVDVSHSLNISVPRVNLKSQRQNVLCNFAIDVVRAFWRLYSD